jgi:hypothetical protein
MLGGRAGAIPVESPRGSGVVSPSTRQSQPTLRGPAACARVIPAGSLLTRQRLGRGSAVGDSGGITLKVRDRCPMLRRPASTGSAGWGVVASPHSAPRQPQSMFRSLAANRLRDAPPRMGWAVAVFNDEAQVVPRVASQVVAPGVPVQAFLAGGEDQSEHDHQSLVVGTSVNGCRVSVSP